MLKVLDSLFRSFWAAVSILAAATGAAAAENWYTVQIPLGTEDKAKFELCKKIGELGGIDGSVNCGRANVRSGGEVSALTYFSAQGPESMVRELFSPGSVISNNWNVDVNSVLNNARGYTLLTPRSCAVQILPQACECLEIDGEQTETHCIVKAGGEIPWPLKWQAEIKLMQGLFSSNLIPADRDSGESLFTTFANE